MSDKVVSMSGRVTKLPVVPARTPAERLVARSKAVRDLAGAQSYIADAAEGFDRAGDEDFRNRAEVLVESVDALLADMAGAS